MTIRLNRARSFGILVHLTATVCLAFGSVVACAQVNDAGATGTVSEVQRQVKAFEESCVTDLRAINQAQGLYQAGASDKGYARSLSELGPRGTKLLAAGLAGGHASDYHFHLLPKTVGSNKLVTRYTLSARPIKRIAKDQKSFYTDESGLIRFTSEDRPATASDKLLE